jgi:hypothetical protein
MNPIGSNSSSSEFPLAPHLAVSGVVSDGLYCRCRRHSFSASAAAAPFTNVFIDPLPTLLNIRT